MSNNIIDINDVRDKKPLDQHTVKLWNLANTIDSIIIDAVNDGVAPTDVAGVIANRLGEICGSINRLTGVSVVKSCLELVEKQSSKL